MEKCYFIGEVKPFDFLATGRKELYCDKVRKNVSITMELKRPKSMDNIDKGWRPQDKNECTCFDICKNKKCEHFKTFKIEEQK